MYVNVHSANEATESKGKKTEVWGTPAFRKITLQDGQRGLQITLSCYDQYGTGERNLALDTSVGRPRSISLAMTSSRF